MKDRFYFTTLVTFFILIFLIFIFVFLGTLRRNHIREIKVPGGNENAEFVNARIEIKFSRPIIKDDFERLINIEPKSEYRIEYRQNDLQIIFNNNLKSETKYSLYIPKNIKDLYNEELESDFTFNFTTKRSYLTFIKKDENFNGDKIVESDINFKDERILFEAREIKNYARFRDKLAVIVINEDKSQDIVYINLRDNSIEKFNFENKKILSVDISEKFLLYVSQRIEIKDRFLIPKGNSEIFLREIDSKNERVFNPKNSGVNSVLAQFSPDFNSILYRKDDSQYYLGDILIDQDPILMGRFMTSGGFNRNLNEIIFTKFDPARVYSSFPFITVFTSDREIRELTSSDFFSIDPTFFQNSDRIIYSEKFKEIEGISGFFKLNIIQDGNYSEFFKFDDRSLELPRVSFDDRFVSAEVYSFEDLSNFTNQRDFFNFVKPLFGDLIILDVESKEVIGNCINCIEGRWNL